MTFQPPTRMKMKLLLWLSCLIAILPLQAVGEIRLAIIGGLAGDAALLTAELSRQPVALFDQGGAARIPR